MIEVQAVSGFKGKGNDAMRAGAAAGAAENAKSLLDDGFNRTWRH